MREHREVPRNCIQRRFEFDLGEKRDEPIDVDDDDVDVDEDRP